MKKFLFIWTFYVLTVSTIFGQGPVIIDHQHIDLSAIPIEWITAAKENLHIGYGHTSHGGQLTAGMNALEEYYSDGTYDWSHEGGPNELHLFEGSGYDVGDLDHDLGSTDWDTKTRNYLNSNPGCNVIIWSWCGTVNDVNLLSHYLEPMTALELEYPNVTFVYMTGHLEGQGPGGSLFIANQTIRDYCIANNKVLFDFADIEKYDPDAEINYQNHYANDGCYYDEDGLEPIEHTENWANDWVSANPTHLLSEMANPDVCGSCAHSVRLNCIKKGIATWYLWSRIAGWNGSTTQVPVTDINITSEGGSTSISSYAGTLQLYAEVLPVNASYPDVEWSVQPITGDASVNSSGLVTAIADGTVTITASATDDSGVSENIEITISNQEVLVESITITSEGDATTITTPDGTLQLSAEVLPAYATNPAVAWTVTNGTGEASVSVSGLVTAEDNGTVTITASATDGSGISDDFEITISNQPVPVEEIVITSEGDENTISTPGGTLQLYAEVLPLDASNSDVLWSLIEVSGEATVNTDGLVTAIDDGDITIIASATDGSGISSTFDITLSNQKILVENITISSPGGVTEINTPSGTLQLSAEVMPLLATNPAILWSVIEGTGNASITTGGLVTALANGTVTITASAIDGSGVSDAFGLTISNQPILVEEIIISSEGGATIINTVEGTLQLSAEVLPIDASNQEVLWSIEDGTGEASISTSGLVTAVSNGVVTAMATATDGSEISGDFEITISNQPVAVEEINISSEGDLNIIEGVGNTLQLSAEVLPEDATLSAVEWTIVNGTGQASVSTDGLVTAVEEGTVTAVATATDESGISDEFSITIAAEIVLVEEITISSAGDATTISTLGGSLQLSAVVLPENATNPEVTWSIQNGSGQASISPSGLVTAISNGTVTASASANDGSGISGTFTITISNQFVFVSGITISSAGGATSINTADGSLQLSADVLPINATNATLTWSIHAGAGLATVSSNGLVTAIDNGSVTVRASSTDGSGISNDFSINITNQPVAVSSINITSAGGLSSITTSGGSLQLFAEVLPVNATNSQVLWSVQNGTGLATVNSNGLVTAQGNGTVTISSSALDGSGISSSFLLTISNQQISVDEINVTSIGGQSTISTPQGTLQLFAEVLPENASNPNVLWSVQNSSGLAIVSTTGLVTAQGNGEVTVTASALDGSGKSDAFPITITNQLVLIEEITISAVGGENTISTSRGSLQLIANISPVNATHSQILWSIANGTGTASISDNGLVTAITDGAVVAIASSSDGSGVTDAYQISILNQEIVSVERIIVSSEGDIKTITTDNGSLKLYAEIIPSNASDQRIKWEVCEITGKARISENGVLTAIEDGIVYASAISMEDSNIDNYIVITISGQLPDGINDVTQDIEFRLDNRILSFNNHSGTLSQVRIIDLNGRIIRSEKVVISYNSIGLDNLLSGIYILQFIANDSLYSNELLFLP